MQQKIFLLLKMLELNPVFKFASLSFILTDGTTVAATS